MIQRPLNILENSSCSESVQLRVVGRTSARGVPIECTLTCQCANAPLLCARVVRVRAATHSSPSDSLVRLG